MNMNTRNFRQARQRGFTLLETLVAIVIFSIGLLGVVGLQARSIQFAVDGEDRNSAALMADGIVAALWSRDTATVTLTDTERTALAAAANGGPRGATATIGAPDANGVVEIRITWHPPSRPTAEPDSVYVTKVSVPVPQL
jgi:type IV pilus assembly protein PilV